MSKQASPSNVKNRIENELPDNVRVLTHIEDRFIYSVEKWFDTYKQTGNQTSQIPEIVVRTDSEDLGRKAYAILEEHGFTPAFRDQLYAENNDTAESLAIIDTTSSWKLPVDLDQQADPISKADLRLEQPRSAKQVIQDRCATHNVCKGYCPINETVYDDLESFSAKGRAIIASEITNDEESSLELSKRTTHILFSCATCGNCFRPCTENLDRIYDALIEAKQEIIESRDGYVPNRLQDMLENSFFNGNPYGEPQVERSNWTEDMDIHVPVVESGDSVDVLFFVGCDPSYNDQNQIIARSLARIFDNLDLDWGILGTDEKCAGNHQRAVGEIGLFEELAEHNIEKLDEINYDTLVTADPHSFHSFKNEYDELGADLSPLHYTEFLDKHVKSDQLSTSNDASQRVAYHDSCYLERHNKVTAEPRRLLKSLPGYEYVEIDSTALCCGGGGGRMWFEDPEVNERPAMPVIDLARSKDIDILAVACPFCATNFEDARKTGGHENEFIVREMSELIADSLAN